VPAPDRPIADLLARLGAGGSLSEPETQTLFNAVLAGHLDQPQIEAMLLAIAKRGPTVDELVGAARALRSHATPVQITSRGRPILDTCGTGGAPKLFNISTISAIVTAAAAKGRVLVAKHGNRSRTGRGSAELLEALGVNISASPEVQARCLNEIGLCFSFAPGHHPAARHAAAARKALGIPTIFNLLGPLANPAGATCQVIGTYSLENARKLALASTRLGVQRAMVITSADGRDELTTTALNWIIEVPARSEEPRELAAESFGLATGTAENLTADSLPASVALARAILDRSPDASPARDVVLLNVAAALIVSGISDTWMDGLKRAEQAVASGAAAATLSRWIALSHS
jgi:anthranilate phosphoribosyltransferase